MKREIVAVLPARAGSKGIPNKNIRLIGGRPLVWYSIRNALVSERVTRVIVSTDSVEVALIAKEMGAEIHWRDERLCADDVTLDAVIYDAIREIDCDYVVTMQPTSPTLRVETLDSAIDFAIEENADTVISVVNKPHLAWRLENGKPVPAYEARLNRQYLPPYYEETGAFVISRRGIVTEKTRIGDKICVFPMSEEEGIDVDTFRDLRDAEECLRKESVAIYVNGNNQRGVGHIYRALEVSDEFYVKPDIYYDINQTEESAFGSTTHHLIGVDGIDGLLEQLRKRDYTLFINDILTTDTAYMLKLREALPSAKIVNFEDDGSGIDHADLVINALFEEPSIGHVHAGYKYYIAAKPFLFYEPSEVRERVENVLITFGGADPMNYTDRLLKIISEEKYRRYHFTVVLGRAKKNVDELMKYGELDNVEILRDVRNMAELMSQSDIAVTSRGRTGYELALLGVPSIAMAQNEREEKHTFISNENGFSYIGLDPDDEVIRGTLDTYLSLSAHARRRYRDRLLSHDLRHGRKRVMSLIDGL